MLKLTENPEFVELIIDGFIKEGVLELSLSNSLNSDEVKDQITARRILHEYIYGIITTED